MRFENIVDIRRIEIMADGAITLSDEDLALIEHVDVGEATAGGGTNATVCGGTLWPNFGCSNTGSCSANNSGCTNSGRCTT